MKINLFLLLLLCICVKANAQFGIINDKEGYVNVRKSASSNAEIVGKLDTNAIFNLFAEESEGEWLKIYKQMPHDRSIDGYVHKSRVTYLNKLKHINNIRFTKNFVTAKNDSIYISLSSSKFSAKGHKIKRHEEAGEAGSYESIDGKPIWGTDGDLPKYVITSLTLKIAQQNVNVPRGAYSGLYQPNFETLKVYLAPNNTIYIELDNSDGAGSYTVIWLFRKGKYVSRYIDNSEA